MHIKRSYDTQWTDFLDAMKSKYPKSILQIEGIDADSLDAVQFRDRYFASNNVADTSADANANVQIRTMSTFYSEKHKGVDKLDSLYDLWEELRDEHGVGEANRLIEMEICKDLNIQDASHVDISYCWAFDTYDLLSTGLPFVANYPSEPAKHAQVFLQHVIQLVQFAAGQMMGATAIPNILVIYSALLKYDSLDPDEPVPNYFEEPVLFRRYLEQNFQELVFLLNQPLRQNQSCFTNITLFDRPFMESLCDMYVVHGEKIDPEFAMFIQKEFMNVFLDLNKRKITTFPVLTAQIKVNEDNEVEDEEFFHLVAENNIDFAHLNIFNAKDLTAISSCCRLINNLRDLIDASEHENMNLIGGSSIKVGSSGVVTLNLARIGIKAKGDVEAYYHILESNAWDAYKINHARRMLIQKRIDAGQLPLYDYGLMSFDKQYSTLGINGIYESLVFMGIDPLSEEGQEFTDELLILVDNLSKEAIYKYGYRCNVEQIPAESTAIKLAETDRILYGQEDFMLYANQFIPLTTNTDVVHRIHLQARYEQYFSGGTILHANLGQKIDSVEVMKTLMRHVIKAGVQYFAINYFFQECEQKHMTVGKDQVCPVCGGKIIENYTRIVGFIRPVSSWQKERRIEHDEREVYTTADVYHEREARIAEVS